MGMQLIAYPQFIYIQATQPADLTTGKLWYDTTTKVLFTSNGTSYVKVSPSDLDLQKTTKFFDDFMNTTIDSNIYQEELTAGSNTISSTGQLLVSTGGTGGTFLSTISEIKTEDYTEIQLYGKIKINTTTNFGAPYGIVNFGFCNRWDNFAPTDMAGIKIKTAGTNDWYFSTKDGTTEEQTEFSHDFSDFSDVKIVLNSTSAKLYINDILIATNTTNLPTATTTLGIGFLSGASDGADKIITCDRVVLNAE